MVNNLFAYKKPRSYKKEGQIFDFVKFDLLYGYQQMNLYVNTDVKDPDFTDSDGKSYNLTNAGEYDFKNIKLEYKKLNLDFGNFNFAYKIENNRIEKDTGNGDNLFETEKVDTDLLVEILEYTGGYGNIPLTSSLLNHHSEYQLVKYDAIFEGKYSRGSTSEKIEMDKSKTTLKVISDDEREKLDVWEDRDGTKGWAYWEFSTSEETIPNIIYLHSSKTSSGNTVNFVDNEFYLKKYLISRGFDMITPSGFIFGLTGGFGIASFDVSAEALAKIKDPDGYNVTNFANSGDNPLLFYGALRLGYNKVYRYKYSEFEIAALYTYEGLNVFNSEIDESTDSEGNSTGAEDKANLIFDRGEHLNKFLLTLRWTF